MKREHPDVIGSESPLNLIKKDTSLNKCSVAETFSLKVCLSLHGLQLIRRWQAFWPQSGPVAQFFLPPSLTTSTSTEAIVEIDQHRLRNLDLIRHHRPSALPSQWRKLSVILWACDKTYFLWHFYLDLNLLYNMHILWFFEESDDPFGSYALGFREQVTWTIKMNHWTN